MKKMALMLALALAASGTSCAALAEQAELSKLQQAEAQYEALERGSEGRAVRDLMQRLSELEFYSGDVDDKFGPGMASAVRRFNVQHGLGNSEVASVQTQELAFSQSARRRMTCQPVISAVSLEMYEGKPVFSIKAYNPQESDITFLSVIYRCYDINGAELTASGSGASAIGHEPKFAKLPNIELKCGEMKDLRSEGAFDLSAYPGVNRVEAALYCYQTSSEMLVVPECYFEWVSSDGRVTGTAAENEKAISSYNRTAEQDAKALRFLLGANFEYIFAYESARYGLPCGLYITEVTEGGCCDRAGLKAGDVITSIAGVKMDFEEALYMVKGQMEPDVEYALEYTRGDQSSASTISWSESGSADAGKAE